MTEETRYAAVPSPDAHWREISEFAITINGYEDPAFSHEWEFSEIAGKVSKEWRENRTLPEDLMELRGCLFFEQRRAGKYTDFDPYVEWDNPNPSCGDWIEYIQALVDKIREVSDGTVEVRDPNWEPFPEGLR